jgi:hypothetical protein
MPSNPTPGAEQRERLGEASQPCKFVVVERRGSKMPELAFNRIKGRAQLEPEERRLCKEQNVLLNHHPIEAKERWPTSRSSMC